MNKPVCPNCGGPCWDNRPKKATGEFSAKSPDHKCKDKECGGVIWPGETIETQIKGGKPEMMRNVRTMNDPITPGAITGINILDERQRAIIRQHSQSMALELLTLKGQLGQLGVEDLSPAKLRALADYFDNDVLNKGKVPIPPPSNEQEIPWSDQDI